MTLPEDIPITTEPSEEYLNERQRVDYLEHREDFLEWLYVFGKDPKRAEGYSAATVKTTAYKTDATLRWLWEREGYTTDLTHSHADSFVRELAGTDYSNSHKAKCVKALKRYSKWCVHVKGAEEWEPPITFSDSEVDVQPRDYLTKEERSKVREAALEYGSIPSYTAVTPEERSQWKAYLAQRFGKPVSEVSVEDWNRANGWKIPSMVWASLDAGLRPVEVERATVKWVDTENGVLRIPKEESSKNTEHWVVGLRDQTAQSLARWMEERPNYPEYAETDALWLTRQGNPYQSHSLRYVLHQLCEIAEISTEHRSLSWYAIRHSVGTYMSREDGLAAAQAQLRHKSSRTTMRYDQAPVEDRKRALEKMG